MGHLMDRLRPVPRPASSPQPATVLSLTPAQFSELIAAKLDEVCGSVSAWALPVVVTGILGDLPVPRYGTFYRLPLIDPEVSAAATYLNVKEAILDRADVAPGDRVRVTGTIAAELFRGEMSVRLQVIAVEHEAPEAVPQQRTENLTVDTLRRLALDRRSFPSVPQPTVALIHSAASTARVADDFLGALGSTVSSANVQRIPTSMQDPVALAGALRTEGRHRGADQGWRRSAGLRGVRAARGAGGAGNLPRLPRPGARPQCQPDTGRAGRRPCGIAPATAGEHVRRRIADGRRQTRGEQTIAELREALEREQALSHIFL